MNHIVKINAMVISVIKDYLTTDILLTWQGILNYNFVKVLKRPHIAEHNTPVSSAFFSSKDFTLCSSVGVIKNLIRQGIYQPSICGFERSSNPLLGTNSKKHIGGPHG